MPGPPTTPESISSKGGNLNIRRYADSSPAPEPHDANGVSADEPVAFIPMASVAEGGGWVSAETRPLADGRKGYTLFQHGDVIIAKITPCFENGKVALLSDLDTEYGLGSTEFHVLRAKPGHDPRFIYHWTRHPALLRAGEASMTGSAGQRE